jgi:hypothetical protein
MKKLLLFLFLFPGFSLFSQVEAGDYSFSFSSFDPSLTYYSSCYGYVDLPSPNIFGFAISSLKSEETGEIFDFFTVGFSASGQHFVTDKVSAGLNLGFFMYKDREKTKNSTVLYSMGPEVRLFIPFSSKWYGRVKMLGTYGWIHEKYEEEWTEEPINCTSFRGAVGFAYFPASCISLDMDLGYQYSRNCCGWCECINHSFIGELGFSLYIK